MSLQDDLLGAFEVHSPEMIAQCISDGIDINKPINSKPPIDQLIGMYLRSDRFSQCVKVVIDAGAKFKEKPVLAVLLGNADDLEKHLTKDPAITQTKYTLPHAFTPLEDVTLLHICAEFNQVACAKVLIAHGADIHLKDLFRVLDW
jgi:hypothetical protein